MTVQRRLAAVEAVAIPTLNLSSREQADLDAVCAVAETLMRERGFCQYAALREAWHLRVCECSAPPPDPASAMCTPEACLRSCPPLRPQ